ASLVSGRAIRQASRHPRMVRSLRGEPCTKERKDGVRIDVLELDEIALEATKFEVRDIRTRAHERIVGDVEVLAERRLGRRIRIPRRAGVRKFEVDEEGAVGVRQDVRGLE